MCNGDVRAQSASASVHRSRIGRLVVPAQTPRAGPAAVRHCCGAAPFCRYSSSCLVAVLIVGRHWRRIQLGRLGDVGGWRNSASSLGSGAAPSRLSSAAAQNSQGYFCSCFNLRDLQFPSPLLLLTVRRQSAAIVGGRGYHQRPG